ncbi:uncharacterized protein LOC115885973 [Sitophilus oryzae]|uniref:Uncharacterized protein LOC115885973 n=1 Tax=Sitophilus oryzae TaxID=7048 RepID=A0A6J2YBN0_SITOR|nr:uncharacterized protein LOC115885973 [Sitophilus oryzae]
MNIDGVFSTLLIGDETNYIALKFAIDCAEKGLPVWYISTEPIHELPNSIIKPCREVLKLITFIYLQTYSDLIKHLNGIQNWRNIPRIIILKNFEIYSKIRADYSSAKAAYLCAILLNTMSYVKQKLNSAAYLLVFNASLDTEDLNKLQVLYDMYFRKCYSQSEYENDDNLVKCIEEEISI